MKIEAEEQEMLTRYLLGELPEVEQVRIEDRAFRDQEFLARLQDAENDLMDYYARGELSADERARFEQLFLASPSRRERVELARDLALTTTKFAEHTVTTQASSSTNAWHLPILEFMRARPPVFGYALAALAVLTIAGGIWIAWQNLRLRPQDLAHAPVYQPSPNDVRQTESGPAPANPTVSPTPTDQNEKSKPRAPRSTVVTSFVLLPVTRDSASQVKQLAVPRESQQVQLRLELERREPATSFSAELKRAGTKVWGRENLSARLTQNGGSVILSVPANILAEGQYEVTLSANTPEGFKNIGFYYFAISRK